MRRETKADLQRRIDELVDEWVAEKARLEDDLADCRAQLSALSGLYGQYEAEREAALAGLGEAQRSLCRNAAREIMFWVRVLREGGLRDKRLDDLEYYGKCLSGVKRKENNLPS